MQLSKRMEMIVELMPGGACEADVGTDHAQIPIELVRRHIYPRIIAMDVKTGPLEGARKNVEEAGLEKAIELRLADGLSKLQPGEADTISISGMGGPLIERILTVGEKTAKSAKSLILSPQSELFHFRKFLKENGYLVETERVVEDEGKFYFILRVTPGEDEEEWTVAELFAGKRVDPRDKIDYASYLRRELRLNEEVLAQLADNEAPHVEERREQRRLIRTLLTERLKKCEEA